MATHSSILAWRIPRTENPVAGYRPWDGKRVRHTLANKKHSIANKKQKVNSSLMSSNTQPWYLPGHLIIFVQLVF